MQRKATPADFESLYQVYMDPSTNPFMSFEVMEREEFLPLYNDMLRPGDLYVYEVNGKVAATYKLIRKTHRMSHIAYLGAFAIHPDFRGSGLGSQVLQDCTAQLQEDGVKRLELLVVSDNHRAIEFYKRHGFEVEGILKRFIKRRDSAEYLDELAMAKLLS